MADPRRSVRESAEQEATGFQALKAQMQRLARLESRLDSGVLEVHEGSMLHEDGLIENYQPPAYQCRSLINAALDHLIALRVILTAEGGGLPAMAGYTLTRSVVEAAAVGLWIRSGESQDDRVFAALCRIAANRKDSDTFARELGTGLDEAGLARETDRLEQIRDQTSHAGERLRLPTLTSML